jgi:hypothetical protein
MGRGGAPGGAQATVGQKSMRDSGKTYKFWKNNVMPGKIFVCVLKLRYKGANFFAISGKCMFAKNTGY